MRYLSSLYEKQIKEFLKEDALIIGEMVEDYGENEYQKVFKDLKTRFNIISLNGKVIYDSQKYQEKLENHGERNEIKELKNKKEFFIIRESSTLNTLMAYYSKIDKNKNGQDIIIRVSQNYGEYNRELQNILYFEVIFFMALNFMIHFFYKNYLKRDMYRKLTRIKTFLESGQDKKEVYLGDDQWILQFWRVVKEWQEENIKNIERLAREKEVLEKIIDGVESAIILLDENFKFTVRNNNLLYLFEKSKYNCIQGIKYIEIIEVIKKAQNNQNDYREEIYIQDLKKYFLISIKKLNYNREYLVTIKDITISRESAEIQRKFISNISHELKTPLTNIKGYLIALKDAPESLRKNFLNTVERNIEKMENIILDFLNMTKAESLKILNIGPIGVDKLEKQLREEVDGIVNKKNGKLEFNFEILSKDNYIKIDYEKILMILKNLIENGFIYNNSKIPEVVVNLYEMKTTYKFIIKDNGLGIEKNKIDKIFERFYRIDKARTSNVAGTGLGLSIVKEIIDNYKGEIKIISKENKGTIFTIIIPK